MLTPTDIRAAIEEIDPAADSLSTELAIEAHKAGRAAWWARGSYSDAFACILRDRANEVGLDAAVASVREQHSTHYAATPDALIARMLPLNAAACAELRAWLDRKRPQMLAA